MRTDLCPQVPKMLEAHLNAPTLSKLLGHWVAVVVRVSITMVNTMTKATSEERLCSPSPREVRTTIKAEAVEEHSFFVLKPNHILTAKVSFAVNHVRGR